MKTTITPLHVHQGQCCQNGEERATLAAALAGNNVFKSIIDAI